MQSYDDFGDDFRLAEGFDEEVEKAAEEDDGEGLYDEEREGEVKRMVALPQPVG